MKRADLGGLVRMEAEAFERPWSREVFQAYLASPRVLAEVVEGEGEPRAFYMVELEPARLHVLNITVGAGWRRQGIGKAILERIDEVARQRGRVRIELEVQERNLAAQLLYRGHGYRAVRILRAHYEVEDGYLMRRELDETEP